MAKTHVCLSQVFSTGFRMNLFFRVDKKSNGNFKSATLFVHLHWRELKYAKRFWGLACTLELINTESNTSTSYFCLFWTEGNFEDVISITSHGDAILFAASLLNGQFAGRLQLQARCGFAQGWQKAKYHRKVEWRGALVERKLLALHHACLWRWSKRFKEDLLLILAHPTPN